MKIVDNERVQEWLVDDDIQEWLDSWDYRKYIRDALVEYTHMNGQFTEVLYGQRGAYRSPMGEAAGMFA